MSIQTTSYTSSLSFGEFSQEWKTSDYLSNFLGIEIENSYTWDSGDTLKYKYSYDSKDFKVEGLGAYAGVSLEKGELTTGIEAKFEYNLGELHVNLPLSPSLKVFAEDKSLMFDFLPDFDGRLDYIAPYATASLATIFDYDIGSAKAFSGYSGFLGEAYQEAELFSGGRDSLSYDIINLDTREEEQVVNIPFAQEEFSAQPEINIDFGEYLSLGLYLPDFDSEFISESSQDEYSLKRKSETTLLDTTLHLDKILSGVPQLRWLSGDTDDLIEFEAFNSEFELDVKWDAFPIDLIAELNFGYEYKLGLKNLEPEIVEGEITTDITSYDLLDDLLVKDVDSDSAIDLSLEFNPDVFFSARAYLRPDLKLDIDVARLFMDYEVEFPLSDEYHFEDEFTVIDNDEISLSELIDESFEIDIFSGEVSVPFNDLNDFNSSEEDFARRVDQEIPFNSIFPNVGTPGADILLLPDSAGNENLYGEAGNDELWGNSSANRIMGGRGSDTVFSGAGNDVIYGDLRHIYEDRSYSSIFGGSDKIHAGAGNDVVYAGGGNDRVDASSGDDSIYAGTGNDDVSGGDGKDSIYGEDGDDILSGGDGNDSIIGGDGSDDMDGGEGNDLTSYKDAKSAISMSLKDGGWRGEAIGDRSINIESLEGSLFSDHLGGDDSANELYGLAGNDTLAGHVGDDSLSGGEGDDVLIGGQGNDIQIGGPGNDTHYAELGNDIITDLQGDNYIDAGQGDNQITAGDGNDTIVAGPGNDTIIAGNGNNIIRAGEGHNYIVTGSGEDLIYDGAGNDQLFTGKGDDLVYLSEGDNLVNPSTGNDTIFSGNGSDTFVLNVGQGYVSIMQFDIGKDLLSLGSTGVAYEDLTFSQSSNAQGFYTAISTLNGDTLAHIMWRAPDQLNSDIFI